MSRPTTPFRCGPTPSRAVELVACLAALEDRLARGRVRRRHQRRDVDRLLRLLGLAAALDLDRVGHGLAMGVEDRVRRGAQQQEDRRLPQTAPRNLVISKVLIGPAPARDRSRIAPYLAASPRAAQGCDTGPTQRPAFHRAGHLPWSRSAAGRGLTMQDATGRIAFQGTPGAYSHQACTEAFPGLDGLACNTSRARSRRCARAAPGSPCCRWRTRPTAGSPTSTTCCPSPGCTSSASISCGCTPTCSRARGPAREIRTAISQAPLLGQCRDFLRAHGIAARVGPDTAGSAEAVAKANDPSLAALASELAAEITGSRCSPATSRTSRTTPPASWRWRPSRGRPTPRTR